jgi:hypothetical protein
VRKIKMECRILVGKPQGTRSRGKWPRQEDIKIIIKREPYCWGGETLIVKFVCGQTAKSD